MVLGGKRSYLGFFKNLWLVILAYNFKKNLIYLIKDINYLLKDLSVVMEEGKEEFTNWLSVAGLIFWQVVIEVQQPNICADVKNVLQ